MNMLKLDESDRSFLIEFDWEKAIAFVPFYLHTQIATLVKRVMASPRSVQVRELGCRWGSCGHKGDLYLHWRVAMLPRTMIEYIEPQYTNTLLDRLERMVPDYLEPKCWLAKNGVAYDLSLQFKVNRDEAERYCDAPCHRSSKADRVCS